MSHAAELFHFRISHFNEKVRWALDYKGVPHRRTALTPGFHIPKARALSGHNTVPLLVMDGRVLKDSTDIIARARAPSPRSSALSRRSRCPLGAAAIGAYHHAALHGAVSRDGLIARGGIGSCGLALACVAACPEQIPLDDAIARAHHDGARHLLATNWLSKLPRR